MYFIPGEFLSGTPSYHFRFVVASNHAPRSIVRCDSVSHAIDPVFDMDQMNVNSIFIEKKSKT